MFNKPTRRKKLYAIISGSEFIGVFPTKKMAKELNYEDKQIIELFWTGGFYTKDSSLVCEHISFNYEYDAKFDF
jgi:hypothetical protein